MIGGNSEAKKLIQLNNLFQYIYKVGLLIIAVFFSQSIAAQQKLDSTQLAMKHIQDSTRAAQKHLLDSTRAAQKHILDSTRAVQKQRSDSLATIRAYKSSKKYIDSVEKAKKHRIDSLASERNKIFEAQKKERQRVTDSAIAARKHVTDSIKAVNAIATQERLRILDSTKRARQVVADSMAKIRAYRSSKRYQDSVATVRQQRLDSIKVVRTAYNDSVRKVQRAIIDSTIAERKRVNDSTRLAVKAFNDSLIAERKRVNDSFKAELLQQKEERTRLLDSAMAARKVISDSMAKVREARKLESEEKLKKREKKKQQQFVLNMEKERAAYTNEKLRKKRWSFNRRIAQNTTTRYNYVYNANLKMNEAEKNMYRNKKEIYDSLIALLPINPNFDSSKMLGDMDSLIRRASVGIQIHDPRSKWQDDLYLLVGKAYFYKGDYVNASNSFRYIIAESQNAKKAKQKKEQKDNSKKEVKPQTFADPEATGIGKILQHTPATNEAIMLLARTFVYQGKPDIAQLLVDLLRNDAQFPKDLIGRLNVEQANIDLYNKDYEKATKPLDIIAKDTDLPNWLRMRAAFLNGQLLMQQQQYDASYKAFDLALKFHPNLDMSFTAQMNMALNSLHTTDVNSNIESVLTKMIKDDKYKPYLDQVYYALAQNAFNQSNDSLALVYFNESIAASTDNARQKGTTYVGKADLIYNKRDFINAIGAYDSATLFLTEADKPYYEHAVMRSTMLNKILEPRNIVMTSDSLLSLSKLPEVEQRKYLNDYLKDRRKAIIDSIYLSKIPKAENTKANTNAVTQPGKWYFSNPAMMQKGAAEFTQKWGIRTLKDNWRRSTLMANNNTNSEQEAPKELTPEEQADLLLPNYDSLYAAIPKDPATLQKLEESLRYNLFYLGKGYYYDLEDYKNAKQTFDTLDAKFPMHEFKPEVLYINYLIASKAQNTTEAANYYNELIQKYPNSQFAIFLTDNIPANNENQQALLIEHYNATYDTLVLMQYEASLRRAIEGPMKFQKLDNYGKKYELIKIMSLAGLQQFDTAEVLINEFIKRNAKDSLIDWATTVSNYIKKNKFAKAATEATSSKSNTLDSNNSKQNLDATNIANVNNLKEENITLPNDTSELYKLNLAHKHYVAVIVKNDNRAVAFRSGWNDYNQSPNGEPSLKLSNVSINNDYIIVIAKEFDNAGDARKYLNKFKNIVPLFKDYQANEYDVVLISDQNFAKLISQKDIEVYKKFYKNKYPK